MTLRESIHVINGNPAQFDFQLSTKKGAIEKAGGTAHGTGPFNLVRKLIQQKLVIGQKMLVRLYAVVARGLVSSLMCARTLSDWL